MSKYDDISDGEDMVCPYCEHHHALEPGSYSEKTRIEKCDECGKNFAFRQKFDITNISQPCCVENGSEHTFVDLIKTALFCDVCGKIKPLYPRKNDKILPG